MNSIDRVIRLLGVAASRLFRYKLGGGDRREALLGQITEAAKAMAAAMETKRPTGPSQRAIVRITDDRDADDHAASFSHFAAFTIVRWPSGRNGRPSSNDSIFVYGRHRVPGELLLDWGHGKTEVDTSVTCSLQTPSHYGNRPDRSRIDIREEQNNDGFMVPYGGEHPVDGRHFCIELRPSLAMWTTVLDSMLPRGAMGRGRYHSYAIVVPMTKVLEGRPITLGADEPFLSEEDLPCSELVLLQFVHRGSKIEDTRMYYLTEVGSR